MFNQITSNLVQSSLLWAGDIIGTGFRPDAKAITRLDHGVIRAVVIFDGFSECDCNMHVATDGSGTAISKRLFQEAFWYPFVTAGLRRVTGLVDSRNKKAIEFDRHLGFVYEGLCRNALPDGDIVIMGMLREDCRFIPAKYRGS